MITLTRKIRDKELRRADFLRAAEHLFALKGYYKATMQDIARYAQYATGTMYLYFKDKETLYFSLVEDKMRHLLSVIKEKISQDTSSDARKKIEIFLEEKLAFFANNQDFFRIFILENNISNNSIESKISTSSLGKEYLSLLTNIMRLAQKQKLIKSDLDPEQSANIFRSISNAVIIDWLKKDLQNTKDTKKMSHLIVGIFLSGAGNSYDAK